MSGSKHEADKFVVTPSADHGAADSLAETKPFLPRSSLSPLLQRYDILLELGHGGMGAVYLARDRETNDTVALKVLKDGIAADPAAIEAFKAELLLARRITHPNVCRVYELLRFDGLVAIAMEHIDGESLRSLLRRVDGLSVRQGLRIAREICAALAGAHAQGVIHRDLKPENIMIAGDGTLKVLDFGIARPVGSKDTTGIISGTPAYMSPEQLEGKPADQRSDIYALGLILYEVFTGRRVGGPDSGAILARRAVRETPATPSSIDPYLPEFISATIMRCLALSPSKRFQTPDDVLGALERKRLVVEALEAAPLHLAVGQKWDLWLTAAAILGLGAFLAFASRAIPIAGFKVRTSNRILADRAAAELTRRGFEVESVSSMRVFPSTDTYSYLASNGALSEAVACLTDGCEPYLLGVEFVLRPASTTQSYNQIHLDGDWRSLAVGWAAVAPNGDPKSDVARALAEREILALTRTDVTGWTLERNSPITVEGRRGFSFSWIKPGALGTTHRASATVYDKVTSLYLTISPPPDFKRVGPFYDRNVMLVTFGFMALCVFAAKRIYLTLDGREIAVLATTAVAAALTAGIRTDQFSASHIASVLLNLAGPTLFLTVIAAPTVMTLANRRWPAISRSVLNVVRLRPHWVAIGLAVFRGNLVGVIVAGLYSAAIVLAMSMGWTWPRLGSYAYMLNSPVPALALFGMSLVGALSVACVMLFAATLIRRHTATLWVAVAVGALAWASLMSTTTFEALPREAFGIALTLVCGALFCATLLKLDLLTAIVSIISTAVFIDGYALLGMFSELGNGQFRMLFVTWVAATLWGAWVGFQPLWSGTGKSIAEAFE